MEGGGDLKFHGKNAGQIQQMPTTEYCEVKLDAWVRERDKLFVELSTVGLAEPKCRPRLLS